MSDSINKTQLDIERAEDRGIIHRDYAAHYFRWSFCLRYIDYQSTILDVGCANGMLAQVLYVNKYKPKLYVGVDIRPGVLQELKSRKVNFKIETYNLDVRKYSLPNCLDVDGMGRETVGYDRITCFEMVEHFQPEWLPHFLGEAKKVLKDDGLMLLSTPNFNGSAAANHIHEYTEEELQGHLEKFFHIKAKFGTFASQRDILPVMDEHERSVFNRLSQYYDSNVMSNIFAPLHPSQSRNILWILEKQNR